MAALAKHATLRELHLTGTRATDAAVTTLAALPRLSHLSFGETALTDAGLAALAEFNGLKTLWVTKTRVTDAAVATFKSARPGVTLNR